MRPEELRIGNFYNHVKAGEIQLDAEWISYFAKFTELLEPIPLTEDWLKKMGFEQDTALGLSTNTYSKQVKSDMPNWIFGLSHVLPINNWQLYLGKSQQYQVTTIEFVHQLQNLFYALTGEELTIQKN